MTVAALYVDARGAYVGLPGVDAWPASRDARLYAGPHPVVAHPPCQRWGVFGDGGPKYPGATRARADGGCFEAALASVRAWGGVLEHPATTKAWAHFGLAKPAPGGGWSKADDFGWTCCVEQGHYGHPARKRTYLYAVGTARPPLRWGSSARSAPGGPREFQKPPKGLSKEARAARRAWMLRQAELTGKVWCCPEMMPRKEDREATPPQFRDLLLLLALSV